MPALEWRATVLHEQAVVQHAGARGESGQFLATHVMRRAGIAIQQTGTRGEKGARADRYQDVAGLYGCPQPVDDGRLIGCIGRGSALAFAAAAQHHLLHIAAQHDPGRIGQRCGQGLDIGQRHADRRLDAGARPDIVDGEAHLILHAVGLAQDFQRAGDIEQEQARRHHHEDSDALGLIGMVRWWARGG